MWTINKKNTCKTATLNRIFKILGLAEIQSLLAHTVTGKQPALTSNQQPACLGVKLNLIFKNFPSVRILEDASDILDRSISSINVYYMS